MEPKGEEISADLPQEALIAHLIDNMPSRKCHTRRNHHGTPPDVVGFADNPVQGQQCAVGMREIEAAKATLTIDPNVAMDKPKDRACPGVQLGCPNNSVKFVRVNDPAGKPARDNNTRYLHHSCPRFRNGASDAPGRSDRSKDRNPPKTFLR